MRTGRGGVGGGELRPAVPATAENALLGAGGRGQRRSMRTIGLLGGMSWESTVTYYRLINEGVKRRLGGLHSARLALVSVDFHEIEALQRRGAWDRAGTILAGHARALKSAGAEALVLCTNTMHKVAPQITAAAGLPLIHVADVTRTALRAAGRRRPILLGTRFTMEEPFYRERLAADGLEVVVPDAVERSEVNRIIYDELCLGRLESASRLALRAVVGRLAAAGADSVVLGCTEIGLLVSAADCPVPVFDTTALHAAAAVEWALAEVNS